MRFVLSYHHYTFAHMINKSSSKQRLPLFICLLVVFTRNTRNLKPSHLCATRRSSNRSCAGLAPDAISWCDAILTSATSILDENSDLAATSARSNSLTLQSVAAIAIGSDVCDSQHVQHSRVSSIALHASAETTYDSAKYRRNKYAWATNVRRLHALS